MKNLFIVFFHSPRPRSHVRILIYRKWSIQSSYMFVSVFIRLFSFNLELICTSEFFKKLKLHEPLRLLINNMKKVAQKNCRKMFLETISFAS